MEQLLDNLQIIKNIVVSAVSADRTTRSPDSHKHTNGDVHQIKYT